MSKQNDIDNENDVLSCEDKDLKFRKCRKTDLSLEEKKATKKSKNKKAISVLLIVILTIGLFVGALTAVTATGNKKLMEMVKAFKSAEYGGTQLVPQKDADGYWTFVTDNDFKILQLTDIHIGAGWMSRKKDAWALNAVAAMITAERPDLVIVTGDIAYPVPFQAGTFNNLSATKLFANMMDTLEVYWTFTFGNHDTEIYSYYTRQEICDWYKEQNFKYCIFEQGEYVDEDYGYGNNIIKVKNTSGIVTQALVTIDSHSYTEGDYFGIAWKYDNIHQNQVDWFAEEIDKINAENHNIDASTAEVKSLAFFHIPLVEYRTAWATVIEKDAAESIKNANGTPVKITDDIYGYYGIMGESDKEKNGVRTYGVYCGMGKDTFFETGLEKGLQGVFCGHDHYNNFSLEYKGIRLSYGMSIDYLAYSGIWKEQSQRGCTLITVESDGTFDCENSSYYQDKYTTELKK